MPAASSAVPTSWAAAAASCSLRSRSSSFSVAFSLVRVAAIRSAQLAGGHLEHLGQFGHQGAFGGQMPEGVHADERLDAAVSGSDGLLAEQRQAADQGGVGHVRAAAQLAGPRAVDLHNPDFAAVVLAEQRHGAEGLGLGEAHDLGVHLEVVADGEVGDFLDLGLGGGAQPFAPGEVEPEVPGLVEGTALGGLRAEDLVQRGVHDVRAGVRLLCSMAPFAVHRGADQCVGGDLAFADDGLVHAQALDRTLDVQDLDDESVTGDEARCRLPGRRPRRRTGSRRAPVRFRRRWLPGPPCWPALRMPRTRDSPSRSV